MNDPKRKSQHDVQKDVPYKTTHEKNTDRLRETYLLQPPTPGTWPFSINLLLTSANHWSRTKNWSWKKTRSLGWWQLKYFLEFSSLNLGKMNPFWLYNIFQMGLVQPPARSWILSPVPRASCWPAHLCRRVEKMWNLLVCWGWWVNPVNGWRLE